MKVITQHTLELESQLLEIGLVRLLTPKKCILKVSSSVWDSLEIVLKEKLGEVCFDGSNSKRIVGIS
jgi:hypothetical protein